jgi:hypothetical protein
VTVLNDPGAAATVNYATADGSASAGQDYVNAQGRLSFATGETSKIISIEIINDILTEPNEVFTISLSFPSDGMLTNPSVATITILDNEALNTNSVSPNPTGVGNLPSTKGSLVVYLQPDGIGQWRFPWELTTWRDSGTLATGLLLTNYQVEFKPVVDFISPASIVIQITNTSPTTPTVVTNSYIGAPNGAIGTLTVFIEPTTLAHDPNTNSRAQWQRQGETIWHDSGETIALNADTYLVQFKPLMGWVAPANRYASVLANQSNGIQVTYFMDNPNAQAKPEVLFWSEIPNSYGDSPSRPYAFSGQIITGIGSGSGFVVKERVVLTAAHVVFDDVALSFVPTVGWFFQRYAGTYEPLPQVPRGSFTLAGYAAQRRFENSPGLSTSVSQGLDLAALYFLEPAGRGGYSGYLVTRSPGQDWLQTSAAKILVGYPIENVIQSDRGRMHTTREINSPLAQVTNSVFSTTNIASYPGSSGGPLCVLQGNYYFPAAVCLANSGGQTVVRAIDDAAVGLINLAELFANSSTNIVAGGVVAIQAYISPGGLFCGGHLTVIIDPPSAVQRGAEWRVDPRYAAFSLFTNWTASSTLQIPLQIAVSAPFSIEFSSIPGFTGPPLIKMQIPCDMMTNVIAHYTQVLPRLTVLNGTNLLLLGVNGRRHEIQYADSVPKTNWISLTNFTLNAGSYLNPLVVPSNVPQRFFRAVEFFP